MGVLILFTMIVGLLFLGVPIAGSLCFPSIVFLLVLSGRRPSALECAFRPVVACKMCRPTTTRCTKASEPWESWRRARATSPKGNATTLTLPLTLPRKLINALLFVKIILTKITVLVRTVSRSPLSLP